MSRPTIHAPAIGENPEAAVRSTLASLRPGSWLGLDTETTGTAWTDTIRTVQFGTTTEAVVLDVENDPNHAAIARDVLSRTNLRHAAHNAGFDAAALAREGYCTLTDLMARMVDTLVLAHLTDPPKSMGKDRAAGLYDAPRDLKSLASDYCGESFSADAKERLVESWKPCGLKPTGAAETLGWRHCDTHSPEFIAYAAADAIDAARLVEVLHPLVRTAMGTTVIDREHWLLGKTTAMTLRGWRLDVPALEKRKDELDALLDQAQVELTERYGITKRGSAMQIAEALRAEGGYELPQTATGKPSTSEEVLQAVADAGSRVAALLVDCKKPGKASGTYVNSWVTRHAGGYLHPGFNTLGSATGRLTMENPSLLNVPDKLRGFFIAEPGYVFVAADFSSVEMRIGAALAGEDRLAQDFIEFDSAPKGAVLDPYQRIAQARYGADFTKADRQRSKSILLGRMYRRGTASLASQEHCSEAEAQATMDLIDQRYPALAPYSLRAKKLAELGETRVSLYSGRSVAVDPARAKDSMNFRVQGTGRELLLDAGQRLDDAGLGDALWLPIHDEWVIQVPEADAKQAVAAMGEAMTTTFMGVPIVAEATVLGRYWCKEAPKSPEPQQGEAAR